MLLNWDLTRPFESLILAAVMMLTLGARGSPIRESDWLCRLICLCYKIFGLRLFLLGGHWFHTVLSCQKFRRGRGWGFWIAESRTASTYPDWSCGHFRPHPLMLCRQFYIKQELLIRAVQPFETMTTPFLMLCCHGKKAVSSPCPTSESFPNQSCICNLHFPVIYHVIFCVFLVVRTLFVLGVYRPEWLLIKVSLRYHVGKTM